MAILSTIKKGFLRRQVSQNQYETILPKTEASLVSMSNGTTVENALTSLNSKLVITTFSIQETNLFSDLQLYYAKTGNIVHVYFSGKTASALATNTLITAVGLPWSVIQQDCRVVSAYSRGDVEIIMNQTSAKMYTTVAAPASAWLRFSFTYISAQ